MASRSPAKLDQAVCGLEGFATWLMRTRGDLAVVIHADPDCANVLPPGPGSAGLERFFCTRLDRDQAAAGRGPALLDACLDVVCDELRPPAVVLLGSCVAGLAGEDLAAAAARASRRTGVPVVSPAGPAMRFMGQVEVADAFAAMMIDLCPPAPERQDGVNLLGFDPGAELRAALGAAGVRVNAVLDLGAPLSAWRAMAAAVWTLVVDARMYSESLAACHRRFGQRHREVPYPMGLAASLAFLEAVSEALGMAPAGPAVDGRTEDAARRAVERARSHTRGRRLGFNLGSLKNFEPASLARAGLVDLPAFEELGFEVELLLQGDDRPRRLEAARAILDGLGCRAPLAVFADTVDFGRLCRLRGCELVAGADYLGEQLAGTRIGFVSHGSLAPGIAAVPANVDRILSALAPAEQAR